jgi:hypothetical protein
MVSHITNPHYLYLHTSIATQTQVFDYLQRGLNELEKYYERKFDRELMVNTIFKYDGTPLKHSYVWCRSIETANVLCNKTPDGVERAEDVEDPDHDTSEAEKNLVEFLDQSHPYGTSWVDLVEEEERLTKKTKKITIKRSMNPVVDFGIIPLNQEQVEKYASEYQHIPIKIFPVSVPTRSGYSSNRLFAYHNFRDLDENKIRKHFEKYATHKKDPFDKKNYPTIFIDKRNNPTYITISFHPSSNDGIFALLMNKKLVLSDKCVLNFDSCKS